MRRRISQRWLLVLLLTGGQLLCLVLAVIWFAGLVHRNARSVVQDRALEWAGHSAALLSHLVEQIDPPTLTGPPPPALQAAVDATELADEGYAGLIDAAGNVLCRPTGYTGRRAYGETELALPDGTRSVAQAAADALRSGQPTTGRAMLDSGEALISLHPLLGRDALVVTVQPVSTIDAGMDRIMHTVRILGLLVTIALVALGAVVSLVIVRRYENRLADTNENLEEIVRRRSAALVQSRSAVILGLAKLAESRDDETGHHLERIRGYVRLLGEQMRGTHPEVDEEFVNTIVDTSALHDIGKVGVPDEVLLNPGRLSDEQRLVIRKHPLIGGDTLLAVKRRWGDDPFLVTACEICFAHHERYDGTGYPFGLEGETIPLAARIVALADVYDALTSARVYKPALTHEQARDMIIEASGSQFDPVVVEAFVRVEESFRAVRQELDAEG